MGKRSGCARNNDSKPGSRPVPAVNPRLDELVGGVPVRTRMPMPSDADRVVSYPPAPRLPRWLIYAGVGAALGAAVLAYAAAVGKPVPELLREARQRVSWSQHKPGGFVPPTIKVPTPTLVVSQYEKQALEEIAMIGQKEPTLAQLLQNTDWFSNGVDNSEAEFVAKIREYVADGNYAVGAITHNDGSVTSVLVLSADKDKRSEVLAKTRQYLPEVSQLLRIEYKRPLLVVDVLKGGGGGANFWGVNVTNPEDLEHELVHAVFEFSGSSNSPLSQVPSWLVEGVPEFVRSYLYGGEGSIELGARNLTKFVQDGLLVIEPLSTMIYNRRPDWRTRIEEYELGFLFLANYWSLVGNENVWDSLLHVYNVRVAKGVIPHRVIINKDLENPTEEVRAIIKKQHEELEAILEQHVPQDKLPQFRQLYQERVYGLPTTQP